MVMLLSVLYSRLFISHEDIALNTTPSPSQLDSVNLITIHYHEKPPYYITGSLDVYGLCADPAKSVFKQANIPFKWEKTPATRQLDIIKANTSKDCGVGWYKKPEREIFAKYSLPIYQDRETIAIKRADNPKNMISGRTVEEILFNKELVFLVKRGYSYGQFIDDKIATINPKSLVTTVDPVEMLKMIYLRRADYFFIAQEEAENIIATSGVPKSDFEFIKFSDMPEGNKRYLIFSKQVEDKTIDKINEAIKLYGYNNSIHSDF